MRKRRAFPKQALISAYLHDFVRKFEKFDTLVEIPGINLTLGDIGEPPACWNTSLKNVAKGYQMARQTVEGYASPTASFLGVNFCRCHFKVHTWTATSTRLGWPLWQVENG